jgi:nitroimidazol reductase NimA-like FMN-containing flavoprotein (pyridoxamine 5'-phosphate oxidase superfamily)
LARVDQHSPVPAERSHSALSKEECATLLRSSHVGRIAVSIAALPVIMLVNYAVADGVVWFRAPSDGALLQATVGFVVAFEADGFDDVGSFDWSVLLRGVAAEVKDPREVEVVESRFVDAWPRADDADRYVIIPATMLSGERYARPV